LRGRAYFPGVKSVLLRGAIALLAASLTPSAAALAQSYSEQSLPTKPVAIAPVPDSVRNASAVVMLENRRVEYAADGEDDVAVYRTVHRRVRVLDDKGVEAFNTVTIPVGSERSILKVEARTILPGGRVLEVQPDDIKRTKNEEGVDQYLFAMKGVERGAEVEYLFTEKRPFSVFGGESFGMGIPILQAGFTLVSPKRLRFETKGYNGFPTATTADSNREMRVLKAERRGIAAIEEEPYSHASAHVGYLSYRLSYVAGRGTDDVRMFTWNELAKNMYPAYYEYNEREAKAVRRWIEDLGVAPNATARERARRIEDALKKDVAMSEDLSNADESVLDLTTILKKKVTTERGFARLMVATLTEAGIPVEIGLTANRTDMPFDATFENWHTADEYIAYLPGERIFFSPTAINYRLPFVPYPLAGQKGVFCKPTALGTVRSAVAVLRDIPLPPGDSNQHLTTATVTFAAGTDGDPVPRIELANSFRGLNAGGMREVFLFTPKDKEKEVVKEIVALAPRPEDIERYAVTGAAFSGYSNGTPLVLSATLSAPGLMEKAGPNYLFKVGDVIGRQVEMYNDEKRTLPIDMEYPHALVRELRVTPPAGYTISNPEAVRLRVLPFGEAANAAAGFVSDYTMEGTTMVIRIREFYNTVSLPLTDYQAFRRVINAAADWNKVVLVMKRS